MGARQRAQAGPGVFTGSGMRGRSEPRKEVARGMLFRIADDGDANAQTPGGFALGYGIGCVVRSFGMYVRAQRGKQTRYIRLFEYDHLVDRGKAGDEAGARIGGKNRATLAFQHTQALVRIHGDYQDVSLSPSTFEIPSVAHMQDIKAAISQHNPLAAIFVLADLRGQPIERQNFISRVHLLAVPTLLPYRTGWRRSVPRG